MTAFNAHVVETTEYDFDFDLDDFTADDRVEYEAAVAADDPKAVRRVLEAVAQELRYNESPMMDDTDIDVFAYDA